MSISSQRIRDLIKRSNKSYQELEKETGIKKSSLQRYAVGATSKIPPETIIILSKYFGVSTDYILGNKDDSSDTEHLPDRDRSRWDPVRKFDSLMISLENYIAFLNNNPAGDNSINSELEKMMLFLFRLMPEHNKLKMVSMARSILEEHYRNIGSNHSMSMIPKAAPEALEPNAQFVATKEQKSKEE